MEDKKRPNVLPVSFKNNVSEQLLLDWAYDRGELYGFSNYVKQLIREDMQNHINTYKTT